jgi:hypothetical protein
VEDAAHGLFMRFDLQTIVSELPILWNFERCAFMLLDFVVPTDTLAAVTVTFVKWKF